MADRNERFALFIDGVYLSNATNALGFEIDFKRLLQTFHARGALLRANYYSVHEHHVYIALRPLLDWLAYNGYSVIEREARSYAGAHEVKKKWPRIEIDLAVDAMEFASRIDHMVLFSANGAFRHLVAAVQRRGVHVTVVATLRAPSLNVAGELRRQADTFVDLADLRGLLARQHARAGLDASLPAKRAEITSTKKWQG